MPTIEICIESIDEATVRQAVEAAYVGGAGRVELCSAMHLEGLTPPVVHIQVAREAFQERRGLMVMIRPRGGNFRYSGAEHIKMLRQIDRACAAGADGVVLGVLRSDHQIDEDRLRVLLDQARVRHLSVTFHRAFDAVSDPFAALDTLIALGVDRVLTAGVPWGSRGGAVEGLPLLARLVRHARNRIEIVAGGGVTAENAALLVRGLSPLSPALFSLHAYSGARENGRTTAQAVSRLVQSTKTVLY